MNATYLDETCQTINPRGISPPPQYSLHEPSHNIQANNGFTDRAQQTHLPTDDSLGHLTTSNIVPDEESTNFWSDEFTARAVLSLLQREPLTPLPRPIAHNDIILQNTPLLTCVVCFETYRDDYFPSTPITAGCDHTSIAGTHICLGCLRRCLDTQFSSQDTSPLACPLCYEQLSDEDVYRWASRQTFQDYDRMRTWQLLEEDAEFVPCIRENCGYGQLHAGGLEDPIVVCGSCGMKTCFIHRQTPWHEGMKCTEYEDMINPRESQEDIERFHESEEQELSSNRPSNDTQGSTLNGLTRIGTLEGITRPCPSCRFPMGRPSGCKFTRCESCLHEWCWDCGIDWKWRHLDVDCVVSPH